MPIKGYDDLGARDEYTVARAWSWAIYLDVEAISFSIAYSRTFESLEDLFEEAYDRGIPILCSAGNDDNPSKPIRYPATLPQALAIGATDESDVITSFSCRGPKIGMVAPGINLFTLDVSGSELGYNRATLNPNPCAGLDYDYFCSFGGTSAAAPEVAAIAALVLSRRPDLKCSNCTADAVYEVLRHSAEDQINGSDPVGFDTTYGWGRLNAARALLAVVRGDADNNGQIDISDLVLVVNYVGAGGPAPTPHVLTGDADGNGIVTISDAVYLVNHIFAGGPPPPISFNY